MPAHAAWDSSDDGSTTEPEFTDCDSDHEWECSDDDTQDAENDAEKQQAGTKMVQHLEHMYFETEHMPAQELLSNQQTHSINKKKI